MTVKRTLAQWLAWQDTLHPATIELSLSRATRVFERLGGRRPAPSVITVGGTNGKGSVVAMLEAIFCSAGYRVGAYTSPHLLNYNERIRVDGTPMTDSQICEGFARIEHVRGDVPLTYFEFGTLAALDIFSSASLDIALLEVGLGGRLDAVNIVDPDIAVVTTVDIDHAAYLGNDRESIGFEKAGIFRASRPAVCGDAQPPRRLLQYANDVGAELYRFDQDFGYTIQESHWQWRHAEVCRTGLPFPGLRGEFQLNNAAVAMMVVELLKMHCPVTQVDVKRGLSHVTLPGRFQIVHDAPTVTILDVAHNAQSARALADNLKRHRCFGRTIAVFAALDDKDIVEIVKWLNEYVDEWHFAGLSVARGLSGVALAAAIDAAELTGVLSIHTDVVSAYREASENADEDDRILVFGSFYTVAAWLDEYSRL